MQGNQDPKCVPGAVVRLRSGGPIMTVSRSETDPATGRTSIVTMYFIHNGARWTGPEKMAVDSEALILIAPAGGEPHRGSLHRGPSFKSGVQLGEQFDQVASRAFELAESIAGDLQEDFTNLSDIQCLALTLLVTAEAAKEGSPAVSRATIAERLRDSLERVSGRGAGSTLAVSASKLMERAVAHSQELFAQVLGSIRFDDEDPFAALTNEQALATAVVYATATPLDERTLGGLPKHAARGAGQ